MAPFLVSSTASKRGMYIRCAWRALMFIALVALLVIYVPVIASESVDRISLSSQWVYVLVLVALTAVDMVLDVCVHSHIGLLAAHWILTVSWLAAFGVFAKIFLPRSSKRHDEFEFSDLKKVSLKHVDTNMMKAGVWILLAVTIMWAVYASYKTWSFLKIRKADKKAKERHGGSYQMGEA